MNGANVHATSRRAFRHIAPISALAFAASALAQGDFAAEVLDYSPAPGQFVNDPAFNDPSRALGPPVGGGTVAPDNSKLISLGGFGGSITLGFEQTVMDDPLNPLGLDCIVFGNAFWVNGPNIRRAEAGVIEIARDVNGDGVPNDPWYVIPGSSLPGTPHDAHAEQTWDDDPNTATPPDDPTWFPAGAPSPMTTATFELPDVFADATIVNPNGTDATMEGHFGYADLSPTLLLGDMSGADGSAGDNSLDDPEDQPGIDPAEFYTVPDDPMTVGVDAGSGGGDAFDIAWAVDPNTGEPAELDGFDFIRISTAVNAVVPPLGEISTEIGGVADVRPMDPPSADFNGDGQVDGADLGVLLGAWNTGDPQADLTGDGVVNGADLGLLLGQWGPVE